MFLNNKPNLTAIIKGNENNKNINGKATFYEISNKVLVIIEISGINTSEDICANKFHACHIHDGSDCKYANDKYINVNTHYNSFNCSHGAHNGDLASIYSNKGYSFSVNLYDKFSINDIRGKLIIIHKGSDDFKTNPSGASLEMIACGLIL